MELFTFSTLLFWGTVLIFVVVTILLVYSLFRLSGQSSDQKITAPQRSITDIIWTLVPIGILIILLILTFQAIVGEQ